MWMMLIFIAAVEVSNVRPPAQGFEGMLSGVLHRARHGAIELLQPGAGLELTKEAVIYRKLESALDLGETEIHLFLENKSPRDQNVTLALLTQAKHMITYFPKKRRVCISRFYEQYNGERKTLESLFGSRLKPTDSEDEVQGQSCYALAHIKQLELTQIINPGPTAPDALWAVRLLGWPSFTKELTQLPISKVELASRVFPLPSSEFSKPGQQSLILTVTARFIVQISTEKKQSARVRVSFQHNIMAYNGDLDTVYQWSFGLHPGAAIPPSARSVLFSAPPHLWHKLPGSFVSVGQWKEQSYYLGSEVKSAPGDDLRIELEEFGDDLCVTESLQNFVRIIKSVGSQATGPADLKFIKPICCPWHQFDRGVFQPSFDAQALFDGDMHRPWCVHGPNLVGAGVEFELLEDAAGIQIANGLLQSGKLCYKAYQRFGGAKCLRFESKDGLVSQSVELVQSEDYQEFDQVFLPKGIYQVTVGELLPQDAPEVCLGEIRFNRATERQHLQEDPFFRDLLSK